MAKFAKSMELNGGPLSLSNLLGMPCVVKIFLSFSFVGYIQRKHNEGKKKYMCVYCHMSKKSRVGRSGLIFFLLSTKPEIVVPGSLACKAKKNICVLTVTCQKNLGSVGLD
jgi:hypothetical protein